jgi:signal transduction histidine kinase
MIVEPSDRLDPPSTRIRDHIGRICSIAAIFLCLQTSLASSTGTVEPKRVMLLHSFGPDVKPWSDYSRAIRAELDRQSLWPLDLVEHSLMTARASDENPEVPFVDYLRALYSKQRIDLIVSIGAPAAAFVQKHRVLLFPTTPMMLTVVEQRRVRYSSLTANDAVVAVAIDYLGALENILRVLPDTKKIAVVVGSSPIEKYWLEEIRNESKPLMNRIAFRWYSDLSFEDILRDASTLPPHSAIFWELMVVDAAGVSHEEGRALTSLHAVANAPIFTYTDAFFGPGIVGGPHVPVLEAGRQSAEVAIRILGGEKAGDIKTPPVGFGKPKYNWKELQRWGISESRLPPGSEIHFREPTAWEQYRAQILAVSAAVLVQAAMILWLLYERQNRHRSEARARALSGRLINAHEEERSRLARELHDDVTQRLALLAIEAGREERNLSGSAAGAGIRAMREALARLSEDVHALSYRLHPSILEDLGLLEALKAECERYSKSRSIRLEANSHAVPENLPRDVALCLFRIAQEGLRNIARHANATQAEIRLRRLDGGLQIVIRDDGSGFDPARDRNRVSLGLASMRQRAALLGGKVDIDSSPGHGTTIRAWIPLKEEGRESSARAAG